MRWPLPGSMCTSAAFRDTSPASAGCSTARTSGVSPFGAGGFRRFRRLGWMGHEEAGVVDQPPPDELRCDHPWRALADSLAIADSAHLTLGMALRLHRALTGREWSAEELFRAGERILTLCRLFAIREGLVGDGGEGYYAARGWDAKGIPFPHTLEELGLEDMIPVVEEAGGG